MTTFEDWSPRVWMGCTTCYNNYDMVGAWYNLRAVNVENLTPIHVHDRYAVENDLPIPDLSDLSDHEGVGCYLVEDETGLLPNACSLQHARDLFYDVLMVMDDPSIDVEAVAVWLRNNNNDLDDFEDAYCGKWRSVAEYAVRLLPELASPLRAFFDYDAYAQADGFWTHNSPDGNVYVFREPRVSHVGQD